MLNIVSQTLTLTKIGYTESEPEDFLWGESTTDSKAGPCHFILPLLYQNLVSGCAVDEWPAIGSPK